MTSSTPTAADDASAADASLVVDHAAPVTGRHCRNCGALAERTYCPACGQATALHPPTVGEFLHEFLGHYVAFEGPLWRTLGALLLTPGRLTAEYFAGRRQRYIGPLRLYLTLSLILFSVNGLRGDQMLLGHNKIQFRIPTDVKGDEVVVFPRTMRSKNGPDLLSEKAIERIEAMTPAERNARIESGMRQRLPYALIVLVPVLALLLKLIYWNRGRLYGEHLVVALHAQTAAFVYALLSAIPLGDWFDLTMVGIVCVQGAIALRRVYGGRWAPTLAREATLLLGYGLAVTLAVTALATASLADLDLLWEVADRVAVLADGKVQGVGSMSELSRMDNPAIRQFFDGPRGRAAKEQEQEREKPRAEVQASGKAGGPSSKPK